MIVIEYAFPQYMTAESNAFKILEVTVGCHFINCSVAAKSAMLLKGKGQICIRLVVKGNSILNLTALCD